MDRKFTRTMPIRVSTSDENICSLLSYSAICIANISYDSRDMCCTFHNGLHLFIMLVMLMDNELNVILHQVNKGTRIDWIFLKTMEAIYLIVRITRFHIDYACVNSALWLLKCKYQYALPSQFYRINFIPYNLQMNEEYIYVAANIKRWRVSVVLYQGFKPPFISAQYSYFQSIISKSHDYMSDRELYEYNSTSFEAILSPHGKINHFNISLQVEIEKKQRLDQAISQQTISLLSYYSRCNKHYVRIA